MTRLGADATAETITALQALGVDFIGRYVSDYPAKNLTPPEAQRLSQARIDIVTNWENDVNDWQGGYNQGVAFARRALDQHTACGGPTGRGERWGVYFSVDQKVDPADPRLHAYFQGANTVLSAQHTGAYAQTSVLRALRTLALIGCGEKGGTWRSMSTFGLPEGLGNPGEFDIEQTGWFNTDYDRNIANSANFGQWRIGTSVQITPEDIMQDAIFYIADGPEKGAIYVRTSDGQYGGVGTLENRDALVALLGVQEKQISGSLHSVFLALAAKPGLTLTDAQAQLIGAAIAAKLPTTLTLTGTETVTQTGKLS